MNIGMNASWNEISYYGIPRDKLVFTLFSSNATYTYKEQTKNSTRRYEPYLTGILKLQFI
ncbi:MAG: Uncharacterised protein [Flavobacteriaceae bacterium]|nr:MAG: Uncharacterised protein [Flavobacteriaceae bacterium]|tara:strand:+ start:5430 stop:5609 length:180 start_codon:yes stop_codon:yes gene_type:complete